MSRVFEDQTKDIPHFPLLYKDAVKAVQRRTAEVAQESSKMEQKRLQHPHRYRCAAVGCEVLADSGKMLSRCEYLNIVTTPFSLNTPSRFGQL